jgi:hypothetical protein
MEVRQAELKAQEEALRIKEMQDIENVEKVSGQYIYIEQQEINHEEESLNEQNHQISETDNATIESQPPQYPNIPTSDASSSPNEVVPGYYINKPIFKEYLL